MNYFHEERKKIKSDKEERKEKKSKAKQSKGIREVYGTHLTNTAEKH